MDGPAAIFALVFRVQGLSQVQMLTYVAEDLMKGDLLGHSHMLELKRDDRWFKGKITVGDREMAQGSP